MLRRRIIPCLDVSGGRVVKGVNFVGLRDQGAPVEAAVGYARSGADEVCWLNITAGDESWSALLEAVEQAAEQIDVPLTVGGGVTSEAHVRELLLAGADKVAINTAALLDHSLLTACADRHGAQCIVVSIDARRSPGGYEVCVKGGREGTGEDAVAWAQEATRRGAGEVLLTSIDADGTRGGYDMELLTRVLEVVTVPVVASGGAAGPDDLADALELGCSAALAASIFHQGTYTIEEVKDVCRRRRLPMR